MKKQPRQIARVTPLAFLLLLLTCPMAFAQKGEMPITASKDALALFLQGRQKAENLQDPGTLFEQAVQKDPNFAIAYLFANRTNQDFWSNLQKAVSLADKVSPGEREWILAAKAQAEGNPAEAKAHLEQLLKLHPGDKRAHQQVGFYYRGIGDDATALKHFEESAKLDKNYAPAYNNIGYSDFRLGKYAEAEQAFKTYIKLIPSDPNPYDSYGELLMKMGRYDESIKQYETALSKDAAFANSYRGVGDNYLYKGDYAKARETFQRMYEKAPDDNWRDTALVSLISSYIQEGKVDDALKVNDRRREMAEKNKDVQALIGIYGTAGFILSEAGRLDDAGKQFEMADKLRDDPTLPAAFRENTRFGKMQNRVLLLIQRKEFGPARAQLDELWQFVAARKNPNQERGYYEAMGRLELGQKNYAKAVEYFSKATPDDPYVWYYTAAAYEGSGDKKKAAGLYRKVVDWNGLDDLGYATVRARASAKAQELAKN